jgi:hypothetical protein
VPTEREESDAQGDEEKSNSSDEERESAEASGEEPEGEPTAGEGEESEDESASDEDEADEEDEEDEERADDGRILKTEEEIAAEQAAQQPVARNRDERRAQKRRDRRGPEREDRNQALVRPPGAAPGTSTGRRVKPPPGKVSGNSTADEVPPWAKGFVTWMGANRGMLALAVVLILVVVGGTVGWYFWRESKLAKAAGAYREALEIELAPIRAADAPAEPPGAPAPTRSYPDRNARAQAALRAFREVESRYGSAPVATLARLNEAGLLYDLGRYAEARRQYESLLGQDTAGQDGRVLEGLGFTLEAQGDNAGALRRYQELGRIDDGAWRDLAAFHQARVEQRLGHNDRARDLLHGIIERLHRASPTDEQSAVGGSGSILEQAQALLRDIDPADPLAQPPALERGLDNQTLQQMFQQRGIQLHHAPAPPGGGAGGEPAGGGAH